VIRLPAYHPDINPIDKIWGIVKTRIDAKNVTFKLRAVQELADIILLLWQWKSGLLFADMLKMCVRREHEMDTVMERFIINADDDDTSESSGRCDDNVDIQGVGPLFSDRE